MLRTAMSGIGPNVKIRNFADAKHYDKQNEKRPPTQAQAAAPAKPKTQAPAGQTSPKPQVQPQPVKTAAR